MNKKAYKKIKTGDCVIFLWKNYCRACLSTDKRIDGFAKNNGKKGDIIEIVFNTKNTFYGI